jgi:hypothetical protein
MGRTAKRRQLGGLAHCLVVRAQARVPDHHHLFEHGVLGRRCPSEATAGHLRIANAAEVVGKSLLRGGIVHAGNHSAGCVSVDLSPRGIYDRSRAKESAVT